jgi:hypothetical protein
MNARRFSIAVTAGALLLSSSGCYKATFYKNASVVKGEEHEEWTDFFVFGVVGTEQIDVAKFCRTGDAAVVRTGGNVGTGLVGALTLGIYTPRKVYVTCAAQGTDTRPARAPNVPAPTARRLELDVSKGGSLLNAKLSEGQEDVPLVVEVLGDRAWRITRGSQS